MATEHYQGLARKWRPQRFEDLVGQESVTQGLANALRMSRVAHGHLLHGPRGVGKTTTARIIAKALNCEQGPTPTPCGLCRHCIDITAGNDLDVIEIDAASNNSVETVRELQERILQAPFSSRYKVYIIDEVHMLSTSAFNAFLKTLEEPPPHVIFVFATTEFEKIPETVRSRCVIHPLKRLTAEDIIRRLQQVSEGEGIDLEPDAAREIFSLIARAVEGGMRDALVIFDQLVALCDGKPTADDAIRLLGLADHAALRQAIVWLAQGEAQQLLALVDDLVNRGRSLDRFVKGLISYLRDLMLLQAGADEKLVALTGDTLATAREQARELPSATLFNLLNHMFELEEKLKTSTQARFLVEFAFLRLAAIKPVIPLDDIIKRIGAMPEAAFTGQAPAAAPGAGAPVRREQTEVRTAATVQEIPRPAPAPAGAPLRAAAMHDATHGPALVATPVAAPPSGAAPAAPGAARLSSLWGGSVSLGSTSPVSSQGTATSPLAGLKPLGSSPAPVSRPAQIEAPAAPVMRDRVPPQPDPAPAATTAAQITPAAPAANTKPVRSPLEQAQAFLQNPDAARRFKMLKDMFSGRVIDDHGDPLPVQ